MAGEGFRQADSDASYRTMVTVHILWIVGMGLEAYYAPRPMSGIVVVGAVVVFIAAQYLRLSAIQTLGKQWNTRVMTPDGPADSHRIVAEGPYMFVRHPNYVAVYLSSYRCP